MEARAATLTLALLALAAAVAAGPADFPWLFPDSNKGLKPTRLVTFGSTHYYQMAENPIGTVAFFHGCARSARNFFPYDPLNCPECLGFPEHLSHTKQALARGYNVLALEPHDSKGLCWSSSDKGIYINDQPQAISTLRYFIVSNNLTNLPIYLWGASSGGTLALKMMGQLYRFDQQTQEDAAKNGTRPPYTLWGSVRGVIAEAATPTDFDASDADGNLLWPGFPPVIFVRMERDGADADVAQNLAFFARNGVPSDVIVSPVRRIGPTYFSDRSPTITQEQSQRIVEGLKQIGLLGEEGWLLANPKEDNDPKTPAYKWTVKLQTLLPWLTPMSKSVSLVLKFSPIQQSMLVAYAMHDAVSDYFTACLAWLEAGGKVDAQPLAHQLVVPGFNLSALTPDRRYPPPPPLPAAEDQDSQPKAHAQQLEAPSSDAKPRRRSQDL
ncbi:hypothetical protein ABPG77_006264 [Micractinium sp. CCAP 211/92]